MNLISHINTKQISGFLPFLKITRGFRMFGNIIVFFCQEETLQFVLSLSSLSFICFAYTIFSGMRNELYLDSREQTDNSNSENVKQKGKKKRFQTTNNVIHFALCYLNFTCHIVQPIGYDFTLAKSYKNKREKKKPKN